MYPDGAAERELRRSGSPPGPLGRGAFVWPRFAASSPNAAIVSVAPACATRETHRMNEPMRRRREHRREFLRLLYELVDGSVSEFVPAATIGEKLGVDETETRRIFEYLEEKRFVMVDDHRSGIIRITAAGIDEVESSA